MNCKHLLTAIALTCALATSLSADTVEIVDGSRIVGQIIESTGDKLKLETEFAGTIEIPMDKVSGFTTDAPIFVRLESGTTMLGQVSTDGRGNLQVVGTDGSLNTTAGKVTATWPANAKDPAIAAKEAEIASMQRKWKYEANVDVNGKSGNTDSLNIGVGLRATLESKEDLLKVYTTYQRNETNSVKSADEIKGGIEYSNFFYNDLGWYVRSELEVDEFENIDLRSTSALGITYRFLNNDTWKLIGRTGLSYRYESYNMVTPPAPSSNDSMGLDFGLNSDYKFGKYARLLTDISYTPSFEDFGDYLFVHDSGLEMPLSIGQWVLRVGINNSYNSQPTGGRDKMDTTYYTRLILKWE